MQASLFADEPGPKDAASARSQTQANPASAKLEFNRDIRPILSEYCFACHGPDKNARQAELRLDVRDEAVLSEAITPGEHASSGIIHRIVSSNPDEVMPPPKTGKQLTGEQLAKLKQWIDDGAIYQSHWSLNPVPETIHVPVDDFSNESLASASQSEKPNDASRNAGTRTSWARNSIDHFVAASLKANGISPAPEVERTYWLRRVSFDLTGLPPSLAELDAFLSDTGDDAYERVVDRLLQSNAYGERMANMWLDVARYADTFGYQADVDMHMWPWRDWVIRAFNDNLPYDQFVTWQTAGDLLPNATQDQRLATAFNRLHRQTNEGGSIEEEFRQVYIADRTVTNGTAFLGLTLECSRCHDHKYDPITQKDFYQLASCFANIDEHGLYAHFTAAVPTPAMLLYSGDQQQQHEALLAEIDRLEKNAALAREAAQLRFGRDNPALDSATLLPKPDLSFPLEGSETGVVNMATKFNGDDSVPLPGALQYGRNTPVTYSIWLKPAVHQPRMIVMHQSVAAEDSAFRGTQLTLDNGYPEFSLIHFWPGNALRVQSTVALPLNQWSHVAITYDGSSRANGVRIYIDGVAMETEVERDQLTRDILHRAQWGDSNGGSVGLSLGARFRDVGFRDGCIDDVTLYHRQLSSPEILSIYCAAKGTELQINESHRLDHYLVNQDAEYKTALEQLLVARSSENEFSAKIRQIMTMQSAIKPRTTHVLTRGAYDAPGEPVEPGIPGVLRAINPQWQEVNDRLALARWMTDSSNPLVSRVAVNRFWHLLFGRGIVASLEDFGSQGQPPTHPELLDWLARDFMNNGWDVKRFCKQVVLSSTYRQSSVPRDFELLQSDPENRLLARGPKHRLSAEQIRDAVLFASELLVKTIGGPSVMPYQPAGLWEEAGTGKSYHQAKGDGLYRRSLYSFWRRTAPPPSMLTFDATSRETCTARRELTATPLQALVLLNDPQYVEASRVLAEKLIMNHGDNRTMRWKEAFRRLISREPSEAEIAISDQLYDEQRKYFESTTNAASEFLGVGDRPRSESLDVTDLAATAVVVATLVSYDEAVTKR